MRDYETALCTFSHERSLARRRTFRRQRRQRRLLAAALVAACAFVTVTQARQVLLPASAADQRAAHTVRNATPIKHSGAAAKRAERAAQKQYYQALVEQARQFTSPELRDLNADPTRYQSRSVTNPLPGEAIEGTNAPRVTLPRALGLRLIRAEMHEQGMPAWAIGEAAPLLADLIEHESTWSTNAVQSMIPGDPNNAYPTRARGLFQYIPETWAAHATDAHPNIFDPVDQIAVTVDTMRRATSLACGAESFTYPSGATVELPHAIPGYGYWCAGSGGWGPGGVRDA